MIRIVFVFIGLVISTLSFAQQDLRFVHLNVRPDFITRSIQVIANQTWSVSKSDSVLKLLVYPQFSIDEVIVNTKPAHFDRLTDGISISIPQASSKIDLSITYHGKPQEAIQPPWDGGFIWTKSQNEKDWLGVACQEQGSQLWFPSPVRYDDEPDSARITCTYPASLFFKSNGKLHNDSKDNKGNRTTSWKVSCPINTYNITLNIGDYTKISDTFKQADGSNLRLEYYPLSYNRSKAIKQFEQVKPMLKCFEKYFGKYPFGNDGFSVVETPYVGMEHQSAIAYGNGYVNGYNGEDYSMIGLGFDFILIHESGHEWWGNSVSAKNKEDFWLQEAFCTYAEYVYVYEIFGKENAEKYIDAKKKLVVNKSPIIGAEESGIDMYTKGALMIHTLQQFASNEKEWWGILREFALEFRWKSISTKELENWFSKRLKNASPVFFEQYLSIANPPILEFNKEKKGNTYFFSYRIENALDGFIMPIVLMNSKNEKVVLMANGELNSYSSIDETLYLDSTSSYFIMMPENE
jgi:aminopeptidase N